MEHLTIYTSETVAPLAGARIEINDSSNIFSNNPVAPLAGARIEICLSVQ